MSEGFDTHSVTVSGLPWEERQRLGFGTALLETLKLFVTNPIVAFQRAREQGDYLSPLLYSVLISWVGIVISRIWQGLFGIPFLRFLPSRFQEIGSYAATQAGSTIGSIVVAPV